MSFLYKKIEKSFKLLLFFSFIQQGQKNISTSCRLQFLSSLITSFNIIITVHLYAVSQ